MDENVLSNAILKNLWEGVSSFLAMVDWQFMAVMITCVFLTNLIFPPKTELPKPLRWLGMHRYRVPVVALVLAVVFMGLRDYEHYGRELVFVYFLTTVFGMTFNLWILDGVASAVAKKFPSLYVFLRGREDEKPKDPNG